MRAGAERLRATGHEVAVPHLWARRVFDALGKGVTSQQGLGRDALPKRAVTPRSERGLLHAGSSMGATVTRQLTLAHGADGPLP